MAKIAIIGSQGMLGSAVCRHLSDEKHQILEINSKEINSNNSVMQFDIVSNNIDDLRNSLENYDFVINCAGLIKHKINEKDINSLSDLISINSLFPIKLTNLSHELNFKVIQIATDCVYSGEKGDYVEDDIKDPVDYYGYSKALGEHSDSNLMTLRCSLIGRELKSKVEFLEWVLNQGIKSEIKGFTDHFWNGLTTLHFAKIVNGIIKREQFKDGTFHLVPKDSVTKFELAKNIANSFERSDIRITQGNSSKAVNRVLATNYPQVNSDLWLNAGYNNPLGIIEMIKEYALWV
jgi:dTDP-4-dehydrorhamnose reductase